HSRTVLAVARPVLLASVAADRRGRLGLVLDEVDLAHANCATPTVPARTRFSTSSDSGRSWSRPVTLGARWWDLASGARGTGGFSGYFIGDYQALAPVPGGFTTIT